MANTKQIKAFDDVDNPAKDDTLLIQDVSGVTWKVKTNNVLGKDFRHASEHAQSSVLVSGGELSVNGNEFDVAAGTAVHVDYHSDPENPVITNLEWTEFTSIMPDLGAVSIIISINVLGAIVQSGGAGAVNVIDQGLDNIVLGAIQTDGLGNALFASTAHTNYGGQPGRSVSELSIAIGPLKIEGFELSPNATDEIMVNRAAGVMHEHGIFKKDSNKDTNKGAFPALTPISWFGNYRDGSGGFLLNTMIESGTSQEIDVSYLDDDTGVLQAGGIGAAKYGLWEVFMNANDLMVATYPQKVYNSIDDAKEGINSDKIEKQKDFQTGLRLGWMIIRGNASDFTNSSQFVFVEAINTTQGASSSSTDSLQQTYNVSSTPEITVKDEAGAGLTIKDSATNSNRDQIFEVTNTSDEVLFGMTKDNIDTSSTALITADEYTPTLTGVTNVSAVNLDNAYYTRVGKIVTVMISGDVNPAVGGLIVFDATLPINATLVSTSSYGAGTYHDGAGGTEGENLLVTGSLTANKVEIKGRTGSDTEDFAVTFMYKLA